MQQEGPITVSVMSAARAGGGGAVWAAVGLLAVAALLAWGGVWARRRGLPLPSRVLLVVATAALAVAALAPLAALGVVPEATPFVVAGLAAVGVPVAVSLAQARSAGTS